jgi:hypothetical protein
MALIGTMFVDFSLNNDRTTDLSILGFFIGIITLGICIYGYITQPNGYSAMSMVGVLLSLLLYVFVNVNNEKYDNDKESKATPSGYPQASSIFIKDKDSK